MKHIISLFIALMLLQQTYAQSTNPRVVDRFLRYVHIDTQSKEDVDSIPSTQKQFNLAKILVEELKELGLSDARVDEL